MRFTQIGTTTIILVVGMASIALLAPTPQSPWALLILSIVLLLFYKLDVQITDQKLTIRFGIGLIRRSILSADITRAETVRNPLWTGWGIRLSPSATSYTISGLDAVELTLKGKNRQVRIGTNVPSKLKACINQAVVNMES